MKNDQSIAIYFWLLLVPLFWGGAFVAAEHIITEIPPVTAAAFRFGSAGILLLVFVLARKKLDFTAIKKQWLSILLMAITGIFGYNFFFFTALDITSAINGSLIVATTPVLLTFGAVLFLGEVWNKQLGFGLILSLLGVVVVISKGSIETLLNLEFNSGDLLFIGGLICWVSHGLLGKVAMRDVSPVVTTTLTTLIGSIFLAIFSIPEKGWDNIFSMSTQGWGEMLFMIICSSVVGFLLWNHGIKQIGASKASIYMNLVPINTALLAVWLYASQITWPQIIGMIMVITGVYFVTFHQYLKNKRVRQKMARFENKSVNN
ncbi:DMT family transporter [Virgibacillus salinus]|uniref:Permease of the drug/metabolite transporter (DMT) superfamily n=1 Tax=Virgibacillus salinus TaxID=553311 RepID=A0A1H1FTT5_9BACI|nr:DMT family transporter [Virgibacillus salinus]SDR04285.1 Permease of the drug/metabolite transporter (DMT) superfamily [Virgibacillus salinus]